MFDAEYKRLKYSYFFKEEPIAEKNPGTYTDRLADIKQIEYGWNHSLSEVINSLIENGLQIEFLHEFPYSVYDVFLNTVKGEDGWWQLTQLRHNDIKSGVKLAAKVEIASKNK